MNIEHFIQKIESVLVAEDDADDFLFFSEAIDKVAPGLHLYRAKNGLECINMVKESAYGLIFLDLNMPFKNGIDCLKFIKSQERLTSVPVIIYSTSHYMKDIDAAFKMDAHYYIIKPGDANELPAVLTDLIGRLSNGTERPNKEDFVLGLKSNQYN